jgi:hypothetical protein
VLPVQLLATKIAISLVAVGSLSVVGVGVAGAASQNGARPISHSTAANQQRTCTLWHRRQAQVARNQGEAVREQARFAAITAKFSAMAARAEQAGNTNLATAMHSVVDKRNAADSRIKANFAARSLRSGIRLGKVHGTC